MKRFICTLFVWWGPFWAWAAGAPVALDKAPDRAHDTAALQNGARTFVTYCLGCHGASFMRYNKLRDIGFSEQQIKDELMFTQDKIGEPMSIAMRRDEAKQWFGAAPPDLTLTARARASSSYSGADWLYTYLRGFYRDDSRPTGWNNVVFANVAMPHVLWELQGEQVMGPDQRLVLAKAGQMNPADYDRMIGDLVAFMVYMAEPVKNYRKQLGVVVLIALAVLFVLTYALKRAYWRDIH